MPPGHTQIAYIVLAAGLGSRLNTAFSGRPKWMVNIDDHTTVAHHQLAALNAAVGDQTPRVVVSGAHAIEVDVFGADWAASGHADFDVIHNDRFAEWNNWYSVLLGLEHLDRLGWEGSTLIINGDLFCPAAWFASLAACAPQWTEITLAVDASRVPSDEAMKVEVIDGQVTAIGKVGLDSPFGEYIGLAGVTPSGRKRLMSALRLIPENGDTNDWYEGGIRLAIADGAAVSAWETPSQPWVEIDDEVDLLRAREIAAITTNPEGR